VGFKRTFSSFRVIRGLLTNASPPFPRISSSTPGGDAASSASPGGPTHRLVPTRRSEQVNPASSGAPAWFLCGEGPVSPPADDFPTIHNLRFRRWILCHPCHHRVDVTISGNPVATTLHFSLAPFSKCTYRCLRVTERVYLRCYSGRPSRTIPSGTVARFGSLPRVGTRFAGLPRSRSFGRRLSEGSPKELRRKTEGRATVRTTTSPENAPVVT
jgi:hypothetical protein